MESKKQDEAQTHFQVWDLKQVDNCARSWLKEPLRYVRGGTREPVFNKWHTISE